MSEIIYRHPFFVILEGFAFCVTHFVKLFFTFCVTHFVKSKRIYIFAHETKAKRHEKSVCNKTIRIERVIL